MTDHAALRVCGTLVELARQQAGGAGADQRIGLGCRADFAVQVQFQLQPFRGALLDEIGIAHALFDGRDKAQAILRCTRRQALFLQCAPGVGDAFAQGCFSAWCRVPGHYVQAMGEGAGHPAAADDTAAQGGEGFDFGDEAHGQFLNLARKKTVGASLLAMAVFLPQMMLRMYRCHREQARSHRGKVVLN
ncbi:hypothetical protein D3C81_1382130 [compost metagenome]